MSTALIQGLDPELQRLLSLAGQRTSQELAVASSSHSVETLGPDSDWLEVLKAHWSSNYHLDSSQRLDSFYWSELRSKVEELASWISSLESPAAGCSSPIEYLELGACYLHGQLGVPIGVRVEGVEQEPEEEDLKRMFQFRKAFGTDPVVTSTKHRKVLQSILKGFIDQNGYESCVSFQRMLKQKIAFVATNVHVAPVILGLVPVVAEESIERLTPNQTVLTPSQFLSEVAMWVSRIGPQKSGGIQKQDVVNTIRTLYKQCLYTHLRTLCLRRSEKQLYREVYIEYRGSRHPSNFWEVIPDKCEVAGRPLEPMLIESLFKLVHMDSHEFYLFSNIPLENLASLNALISESERMKLTQAFIEALPLDSSVIPDLAQDRHLFSCPNGVLDVIRDRFYEFGTPEWKRMDRRFSSAGFWDNSIMASELTRLALVPGKNPNDRHSYDWATMLANFSQEGCMSSALDRATGAIVDRAINAFFKVFDIQFGENPLTKEPDRKGAVEMMRWRLFMIGMMMYFTDDLLLALPNGNGGYKRFNPQVVAMDKGRAQSGKSSIQNHVLQKIYRQGYAFTLSDGTMEETFGIGAMVRSYFVIINETTKGRQPIQQSQFLAATSGDFVSAARKFKDPIFVRMNLPMSMCGNNFPNFQDTGGQIVRRFLFFHFGKQISNQNPIFDQQLGNKIERMCSTVLYCAYKTYLQFADKYCETGLINSHMPAHLQVSTQELRAAFNPVRVHIETTSDLIRCWNPKGVLRMPLELFQDYLGKQRSLTTTLKEQDELHQLLDDIQVELEPCYTGPYTQFTNGKDYRGKAWVVNICDHSWEQWVRTSQGAASEEIIQMIRRDVQARAVQTQRQLQGGSAAEPTAALPVSRLEPLPPVTDREMSSMLDGFFDSLQ